MTAHVESVIEKQGHGELASIGMFWALILELTGVMENEKLTDGSAKTNDV